MQNEPIDDRMAMDEAATATKKPGVLVIVAGLVTSAATMVLSAVIAWNTEFDPMGLYIMFIFPIGALLVGLAAGSGYGLMSWKTGAKIGGGILAVVVVLQIATYWMSWSIDYRMAKPYFEQEMTFFEYYDTVTRGIAFEKEGGDGYGEPLGAWGYGIRALEVLGFIGGGLIAPILLWNVPYCETCRLYMKRKTVTFLPLGMDVKAAKKLQKNKPDDEDMRANAEQVLEGNAAVVNDLMRLAETGDVDGVQGILKANGLSSKEAGKITSRAQVDAVRCKCCRAGHMELKEVTGQGDKTSTEKLGEYPMTAEQLQRLTA